MTAYVLKYADATKIRGKGHTSDDPLSGLATRVTGKEWSSSDLKEKLHKFEKDHERLHKMLMHRLDALHRFHS